MQIVERPPSERGNRFNDLTGQRFGMLTAERHVGFANWGAAIWEFRCDCGNTKREVGAHVKYALAHPEYENSACRLHCGCRSTRHRLSRTLGYSFWQRRRDSFCDRWRSDVATFVAECFSVRDAVFLCRFDTSKPFGPDNFFWSELTEQKHQTIAEVVQVFVGQGMDEDAAVERAHSVSRQRLCQILNRRDGLCRTCGTPSQSDMCQRCYQIAYGSKKARATA